jgi:hypothetical protein
LIVEGKVLKVIVTIELEVENVHQIPGLLGVGDEPKQAIGFDTSRERNADLAEENARLRGFCQDLQTQVGILTARVQDLTLPSGLQSFQITHSVGPAQMSLFDTPVAAGGVEIDDAGEPYDPAIHSSSKTKTEKGLWRKRKGTGKAGQTHEDSSSDAVSTAIAITPVPVSLGEERGASIDDAQPQEHDEARAKAADPAVLTLDDVRDALRNFMVANRGKTGNLEADKAVGKAAASAVLAKYKARVITDIKSEDYASILIDLKV